MPAQPWDDLRLFIQADDFATKATITPRAGGPSRVIDAIYDEPYVNATIGEYEADSSSPRLTVVEADVAGVQRGDLVNVLGREYGALSNPEPDGTGMAVVRLAAEGF